MESQRTRTSIRLTSQQVQEIIRRYPDEKAADIAKDYGVSTRTVFKTASRYGVHKSEAFRNSPASGRIQKGQHLSSATQFKKGQEGLTKGKKMAAIIKNKQKLANWREKCLWKKGHKPYNTGKNGEVRWRKNPGYYFIRIEENHWEFYHRYVWVKHHGTIPAGYNIVFADGNHKNCNIENLICLSNADLTKRNSIHNLPEEVKDLIYLRRELNRAINKNP
jgi:hypothetical protein